MKFTVITLFPEAFSYLETSVLARGKKKKAIQVELMQLRDYTNPKDKHKTVDDSPFGGGPGMVLKVEPIYRAVEKIKAKFAKRKKKPRARVVLFSTRGRKLTNEVAKEYAEKYDELILISGRYEGVDERVAEYLADEELSIGDYVLTGGELPAMVTIDAVSRFVPGVLGKMESLEETKGSYPTYTRPAEFKEWKVPEVLQEGNHKKIEEWRKSFKL